MKIVLYDYIICNRNYMHVFFNLQSLLVACFTEMLRLMDVGHYQKLLGDFQNATKSKVWTLTIKCIQCAVDISSKNNKILNFTLTKLTFDILKT